MGNSLNSTTLPLTKMSSIHDHAHDRLQQQQQQQQQDEEQKMTTTTTITIGPIQQLHHDGSRSSTDNAVIIANNASKLAAAVKHTYSYKKRKYSVDDNQGRELPLLSFPWKLHSLLEKNENEQRRQRQKHDDDDYDYDDDDDDKHKHKRIFGWLPDGKCFAIHDQKRFVHEIMPSYFFFDGSGGSSGSYQSRIQSFQTFQRNLELWCVAILLLLLCIVRTAWKFFRELQQRRFYSIDMKTSN